MFLRVKPWAAGWKVQTNSVSYGGTALKITFFQVSAMQNELTALRPQLLETSDETERLMIKIEQDTIQVKYLCIVINRSYENGTESYN